MEVYSLEVEGGEVYNFLLLNYLPEGEEAEIIADILIGRHPLSDFFLYPNAKAGSLFELRILVKNLPGKNDPMLPAIERWIECVLDKKMPESLTAKLAVPDILKISFFPKIGKVYVFSICLRRKIDALFAPDIDNKETMLVGPN